MSALKALCVCSLAFGLILNSVLSAPLQVKDRLSLIRDQTLISTSQLAEKIHRREPNLRILDGSLSELGYNATEGFKAKHIPGARFFDVSECTNKSSPYRNMLPSQQEFSEYVGRLGITNDDHVVVYDNSPFKIRSSPRVWWMFRVFGHDKVSVLNGGLPKWEEDGFSTTSVSLPVTLQNFTVTFNRQLLATFEDMVDNLQTRRYQVVDSRPANRFLGLINSTSNVKPGHIPRSLNLPFELVLDSNGLIKPTDGLREMFKKGGVDLTKPMIATCRSGILACIHSLTAHLCGVEMPMYDGSWFEYYCRAEPDQVVLGPKYTYEDTC